MSLLVTKRTSHSTILVLAEYLPKLQPQLLVYIDLFSLIVYRMHLFMVFTIFLGQSLIAFAVLARVGR